ncbi:MAG: selenide, water dikinase SelD [Bacteroidetes bacterium]|nr:selenide, water dikinase SelD [Bacteroidota bacterium]
MKPIYLDYNATTPVDREVVNAMRPYLEEHFGNPSSSHRYGIETKKAVEKARRQVAALLNCQTDEVIFTGSATESNNFAIKGTAYANRNKGNHIITSAVEHPAVIEVCKWLEANGFLVTYIPVDEFGLVNVAEIENAITPQTILITVMHANNEVGTIQPVQEIAELSGRHKIIMHTDAAQSVGKISVNVNELGINLLSVAGHKLYAPKGIGALYIRHGTNPEKIIHGADHEQNRRAGTENVLEIVGLGQACEIAKCDLEKNMQHTIMMRDRLHGGLQEKLEDIKLNGHPEKRLPNTLSIGFRNIEANVILSEIEGIAASAGASCHSDSVDVSSVLKAMNVPPDYAMGTIRFSTGKMTTADEIDRAVKIISDAVKRLKPSNEIIISATTDLSDIKLTHFTAGLGCACKLRPQALEKILADLPVPQDANILVGTETADDAAVYRLNDHTAIVQTVDFFTPIADDPYHFGAIAAANALSDIYAMGGKPLFALNIVGFPSNRLPMEILKQILRGAHDKAKEAGVSIIGGHTVDDTEPKYGMAVTGVIDPKRILTNSNARPGDAIILTKPVGTGIITTAVKRGLTDDKTINRTVSVMSTLNKQAAAVMNRFPVNACTDVTGFGLLGHLKEMSTSSRVNAVIFLNSVPSINEAWEFATGNVVPGGTLNNMDYVADTVEWNEDISGTARIILCDAQTSGGLLIAVPSKYTGDILSELHSNGVPDAACIGRFTEEGAGKIIVEK